MKVLVRWNAERMIEAHFESGALVQSEIMTAQQAG